MTSCHQESALTFNVLYKLFNLDSYHLENTCVIFIISVFDCPPCHFDCDIPKDDPVYYKNNDQITPDTALFPIAHPFNFLY